MERYWPSCVSHPSHLLCPLDDLSQVTILLFSGRRAEHIFTDLSLIFLSLTCNLGLAHREHPSQTCSRSSWQNTRSTSDLSPAEIFSNRSRGEVITHRYPPSYLVLLRVLRLEDLRHLASQAVLGYHQKERKCCKYCSYSFSADVCSEAGVTVISKPGLLTFSLFKTWTLGRKSPFLEAVANQFKLVHSETKTNKSLIINGSYNTIPQDTAFEEPTTLGTFPSKGSVLSLKTVLLTFTAVGFSVQTFSEGPEIKSISFLPKVEAYFWVRHFFPDDWVFKIKKIFVERDLLHFLQVLQRLGCSVPNHLVVRPLWGWNWIIRL